MEKAVKLSKSEFVRNYMALQSHRGAAAATGAEDESSSIIIKPEGNTSGKKRTSQRTYVRNSGGPPAKMIPPLTLCLSILYLTQTDNATGIIFQKRRISYVY